MNSANYDYDYRCMENLRNKSYYVYKKIPAAFLEIEFPKFLLPVYFEDVEFEYDDINKP